MGSLNRRIWSGPKEWRPARPEAWLDSPLLSKEENERISSLLSESKREGGHISHAEIAWIFETIKKLSHCGPDDYSFPDRFALFNPITRLAFRMRHKETLLVESSATFNDFYGGNTILRHITSNNPPEAVMLIRPYIRIHGPADQASVQGLRGSTLSMYVDEEEVLRTPIDEHLILEDGSFPRKNRWKVKTRPNSCAYLACPMQGEEAHVAIPEGIACASASVITVSMFPGRQFFGAVTLVTGLVAARYTTQGVEPL